MRQPTCCITFLVLLVERGVSFDQIKQELAKREGKMSDYKDRPEIKNL